jgi:crotonobetainyl-CoA:carnitine CoA-transferase CaiB-like acyl-CoA transferase
MEGPLQGIKIVDLTSMISGPSATMMLADQGAEVIKIEDTNIGDYTRIVNTRRGGFSAAFLNNNRNKKSVGIDLKSEEGKSILLKLIKTADVVTQNFRPGVMERLGLGYTDISKINPKIIYTSISGFGFVGPYAKNPVYDPLVQALSGLASVQAGSDKERPRLVRTILPDKLTGFAVAQAITSALFFKERSGKGQEIKISMLDTVVSFLWGSDMGGHTFVGDELDKETAQSFIDLIYETENGYISVAVQSDKEWKNLCSAFDQQEWLEDPRFSSASLRHENINSRLSITQKVLRKKTTEAWLKTLKEYDVPCAPVLTRKEVIKNEQIIANDIIEVTDHPVAGKIRQSKVAAKFSISTKKNNVGAPAHGQDTRTILKELGYLDEEIKALSTRGIVRMVEQ